MGTNTNGGHPMESRSKSAGMGLAPIQHNCAPIVSTTGAHSSISQNVQQLRAPRTRSASTNVAVDGMRAAQQNRPHASPSPSNPGHSFNNNNTNEPGRNISKLDPGGGNSTNSGQVLRSGAGTPRQPPGSLMDIYAQQLKQYSSTGLADVHRA
jgi:hypothetical protein